MFAFDLRRLFFGLATLSFQLGAKFPQVLLEPLSMGSLANQLLIGLRDRILEFDDLLHVLFTLGL